MPKKAKPRIVFLLANPFLDLDNPDCLDFRDSRTNIWKSDWSIHPGRGGLLPIMAARGGSAWKWYLFQALGIWTWKGWDFTSWGILKVRENCQFGQEPIVIGSDSVCLKAWQMLIMTVKKLRRCFGFVIFSYFEDRAFTAVKTMQSS